MYFEGDCGQELLCSLLFDLFAERCINCALIHVIKLFIGGNWQCESTERATYNLYTDRN